jgi:hypothetical protein
LNFRFKAFSGDRKKGDLSKLLRSYTIALSLVVSPVPTGRQHRGAGRAGKRWVTYISFGVDKQPLDDQQT